MRQALIVAVAVLAMCSLSDIAQAQTSARITAPINNSLVTHIPFSTHPLARPTNDAGRVDPNTAMDRMVLVLRPTHAQQQVMEKNINAQHDPDSASYHHWLTPEEFGAQFGPSDQDIATISSWLQQQGFRVNTVGRGKQFIEFSGTAAQVETAFQTEMHHYRVHGEDHIANASDISLPQAIAPVVAGVLSLHNFPKKAAHEEMYRVHRDAVSGKLVPHFHLIDCGRLSSLLRSWRFCANLQHRTVARSARQWRRSFHCRHWQIEYQSVGCPDIPEDFWIAGERSAFYRQRRRSGNQQR